MSYTCPKYYNNFKFQSSCQKNLLNKCQTSNLSAQQCFQSQASKCPRINGSYEQCTNNYNLDDQRCPCDVQPGFSLCPYPYQLNQKCYLSNLNKLEKCDNCNICQKYPSTNTRVGMWYSDYKNKFHPNGWVFY